MTVAGKASKFKEKWIFFNKIGFSRKIWRNKMATKEQLSNIRSDIDWSSLGFSYMPVRSHITCTYKDGAWGTPELKTDHNVTLSIAATCLHYGQAAFEGLKAFRCKDGAVRIFRPDENAKRINLSASRILGPEMPVDLFVEMCRKVVLDNIDYVPPYGSGGSLYIRPLYIGTDPQIGVAPSASYQMIIMVMPVGAYYKAGLKGVPAITIDDYDRAAPLGTGTIKLGGNYAASLKPQKEAKAKGYPVPLFMDAKTHQYIDEFGTSNFFGITKKGTYATPNSTSILGSITNKSLQQIAKDLGMEVECRPIHRDELGDFAEIGACGTAVVITPISEINAGNKIYTFGEECGPTLKKLYDRMTGIQYGEYPDEHNWTVEV